MLAYDVPGLAAKKIVKAGLKVMIQRYMQDTCPVSLRRFARLVRTQSDCDAVFQCLCDDSGQICRETLYSKSSTDSNGRLRDIVLQIMQFFDVNDDLDKERFRELATKTIAHVRDAAFKWPDDLRELTSMQMRLLLQHTFKNAKEDNEVLDSLQELKAEQADENKLEAGLQSEDFEDVSDAFAAAVEGARALRKPFSKKEEETELERGKKRNQLTA